MHEKMVVLLALALTACLAEPGYPEMREGRTAIVHACGSNWVSVDGIITAIDDWNAKVAPRQGYDPFAFGGIVEDERTYDGESDLDGMNCIYLVTEASSTPATRRLARANPDKDALFVDDEDIVIWTGQSPEHFPQWALQLIVGHELGHGAGLGHAETDGPPSIMKRNPRTREVQPFDVERFCERHGC